MNRDKEPLKAESNQIELVDFRIFERQEDGSVYEGIYGINVSKVREIIVLPELSLVPDAHPAIAGIFNLRGIQVPAVDLAVWLKIDEAPPEDVPRKVIVTEFSHQMIGMIVHQASRIRRISWNQIKPPPPLIAHKHGASIVGTTLLEDGRTLLLIDVEKIVAELLGRSVEAMVDEQLADQQVVKRHGRILVVDDSGTARKQISVTLKRAGYDVIEASDGQEALEKLQEMDRVARAAGRSITDELQAVATDVEMPRMDGYSLTARIKGDETLGRLPVIMHSSLSGENNSQRGQEAGCDAYVVKFDPKLLLDAVEEFAPKSS